MTLRAGSFDESTPDWRGLIRDDGYPIYECFHYGPAAHRTQLEARACAKRALASLRESNTLPPYWGVRDTKGR